ncbi:MAG: F0F1 ATP synthase subunit B [Candidatus Saccharimonadales bacterium]
MDTLLTHFAADSSSSGIGALGVDVKAFIIQLITFVIAFLVLKKWAFKPIIKLMDERRTTIESGVKLGEEMQKSKRELDAKVDEELHEARLEADGIIAAANESSRTTVREAEDSARLKAEGILKAADARIVTDTKRARSKLQNELVGLISEATEVIIGEKVDATKDAQLVERALKGQKA